jgi:hypothetical protein
MLLVAMLTTPWLPGTGDIPTTVQDTGVVMPTGTGVSSTTVTGTGVVTTTAQGNGVITTTVGVGVDPRHAARCNVLPSTPRSDGTYVTQPLLPGELPFFRSTADATDSHQAQGAREPRCCPMCAKRTSVQTFETERIRLGCVCVGDPRYQNYATQPFIGTPFPFIRPFTDVGSPGSTSAKLKPPCCPLCTKKASVQKFEQGFEAERQETEIQPFGHSVIGAYAGGPIARVSPQAQNYVTQPFIGDLGCDNVDGEHCRPVPNKEMTTENSARARAAWRSWVASLMSGAGFQYGPQPGVDAGRSTSQPAGGTFSSDTRFRSNVEKQLDWNIAASEQNSDELTYVCEGLDSRMRPKSVTIKPDSDDALTFTARDGRVIVNGQHVRGSAKRAYREAKSDKIVLQGNVALEYYKQNDRASVKADRVDLDLNDGSVQIMGAGELSTDFVKTPLFGAWAN